MWKPAPCCCVTVFHEQTVSNKGTISFTYVTLEKRQDNLCGPRVDGLVVINEYGRAGKAHLRDLFQASLVPHKNGLSMQYPLSTTGSYSHSSEELVRLMPDLNASSRSKMRCIYLVVTFFLTCAEYLMAA